MANDWNRYAPTAARPAGKPGRTTRPKSVTIDTHAHVLVPRAAEFVKPHLDLSTIPLARYSTPETKALNMRQDADRTPVMTSHDQRLADLDAMGIDLQLVMCAPNQCYYTVGLDIAVKAARMVNDGIAEYVAKSPDRFAAGLAKALESNKPFVRRPVGPDARILLTANRLLPAAGLHTMTRLMMGIPRFGALGGTSAATMGAPDPHTQESEQNG